MKAIGWCLCLTAAVAGEAAAEEGSAPEAIPILFLPGSIAPSPHPAHYLRLVSGFDFNLVPGLPDLTSDGMLSVTRVGLLTWIDWGWKAPGGSGIHLAVGGNATTGTSGDALLLYPEAASAAVRLGYIFKSFPLLVDLMGGIGREVSAANLVSSFATPPVGSEGTVTGRIGRSFVPWEATLLMEALSLHWRRSDLRVLLDLEYMGQFTDGGEGMFGSFGAWAAVPLRWPWGNRSVEVEVGYGPQKEGSAAVAQRIFSSASIWWSLDANARIGVAAAYELITPLSLENGDRTGWRDVFFLRINAEHLWP